MTETQQFKILRKRTNDFMKFATRASESAILRRFLGFDPKRPFQDNLMRSLKMELGQIWALHDQVFQKRRQSGTKELLQFLSSYFDQVDKLESQAREILKRSTALGDPATLPIQEMLKSFPGENDRKIYRAIIVTMLKRDKCGELNSPIHLVIKFVGRVYGVKSELQDIVDQIDDLFEELDLPRTNSQSEYGKLKSLTKDALYRRRKSMKQKSTAPKQVRRSRSKQPPNSDLLTLN